MYWKAVCSGGQELSTLCYSKLRFRNISTSLKLFRFEVNPTKGFLEPLRQIFGALVPHSPTLKTVECAKSDHHRLPEDAVVFGRFIQQPAMVQKEIFDSQKVISSVAHWVYKSCCLITYTPVYCRFRSCYKRFVWSLKKCSYSLQQTRAIHGCPLSTLLIFQIALSTLLIIDYQHV